MNDIAKKLRSIMTARKFNQEELAAELGIAQSTVNRWLASGADPRGSNRDKINDLYSEIFAPKSHGSQSGVAIMGYLGAGDTIEPEFEQIPDAGLGIVRLGFPLPTEMIAFIVQGDSMLPVYQDGGILIVHRHQTKPIEQYFGEEAAVRTSDGHRYLKTVERGDNGKINLMSWNAKPIYGVTLEWIGEIFGYFKPGQLQWQDWDVA